MRTRLILFVAGFAVCLLAGTAAAQQTPYVRRPNVSPYLNLLLPDANGVPGGNPGQYQTLVEPFINQQQTNQANASAINRLGAQVNSRGGGGRGFGGTGGNYHSRFMNYSHYYQGIRR
jgi:hypothetical protein